MTNLNDGGAIAVSASQCTRLFEDILSKNSVNPEIEQQSDRFRLWAGNIGARQVGKSSLDYRLREASNVADMVCQLLHGLQTQLDQWRSAEGTSLLSNRIRETIDDLYALLLIIREPPPLDRYTRSDDIDLSYFREFDARHICEKYPLLYSREWLVARFADANVRRRQFLKYRELHNQKLSRTPLASTDSQNDIAETGAVSRSQHGLVAANATITSHSDTGGSSKAPTLADTVATPFLPKLEAGVVDEFDEARSATTFASYVGSPSSTQLQIPPRPRTSLDGQIFICPLCYFPEQVGNDDSWKRHVLHDLQPYICTFEHCPSTLFASRHAWFEHELAAHRKEWICGICNVRTKSASAFIEHAQGIHQRKFPEKLLPKILQQNERPQTRYKANDCLFCDDWTVNHGDSNVSEDEIHVTIKQFRQHVGRHMEELALFVLPIDLGDDFQSQKAAGEAESFGSSQSLFEVNESVSLNDHMTRVTEQLLNACNQGDLEEARKLVQGEVDVNIEFENGSTPLTIAVENEHFKLAELLLRASAEVDQMNRYGETAFACAVRHGHMSLAALLLSAGADVNMKGSNDETLLMTASRSSISSQMFKWLVDVGADVSAKDNNGRTALLHYFSAGLTTDWEAALDVLSGPMVDIEATDDTRDGFRVLHWIAWDGLSKACRRMLQLGADIDAKNREGNTPLQVAIEREQKEVALLLLDMGADVGELYPTDLHPEKRSLLGWASSNDRLHVGKLVVHKQEGILRRVSKVIRVDSPYVFEVEDLVTNDTSAATQKATLYRGYSTDFIPLRPEAGNDEPLVGPGHHVLARYPGTRLFLPGVCHSVNIKFVTIGFLIDDQGSSRDLLARFVIPWKAGSSRDSVEREPPLSFSFTIREIQPDYSIQAPQFSTTPQTLWLPPSDRRAFKHITRGSPYRWHNGLVHPIPPGEQHYWEPYSTTSIFWCQDRQAFLQVPYDCTKVGSNRALQVPWSKISFDHKSAPDGRVLSILGYGYGMGGLGTKASPAWIPELLPDVYQYDDVPGHVGPVQLAGSLSLLIGLAAFSGPPEKMLETIQNSFRVMGSQWTPHGHGEQGRTHQRGLVVDIGYDSRMGWDTQYLNGWEEGRFGPIIS